MEQHKPVLWAETGLYGLYFEVPEEMRRRLWEGRSAMTDADSISKHPRISRPDSV